jgi:hypothetical protein
MLELLYRLLGVSPVTPVTTVLCYKHFSIHKRYGTNRSRAEKLWLVCGVIGDVMQCDRERDMHRSQKFYATIHSEKITHLTIVLFCERQFRAAVCFRDEQ